MIACAERIVRAAADAGMDRAWEIVYLTPREIECAFAAERARREARLSAADIAAYLTGRYVMLAVHAPKRYPTAPNGIARRRGAMTDGEMRRALLGIAQRRNAYVGR